MSDLVKKYIDARHEAQRLRKQAQELEDAAYEAACSAPLPERLRPATASDIVVGAVLWYPEYLGPEYVDPEENEGHHQLWSLVDEVLRPNDDFKAYVAECGSRLGLEGAFVEITEEETN